MKSNNTIILSISLFLNIFLASVIIVIECRYQIIQHLVVKILKVDDDVNDKSSPDYWARFCWANTIEKLHTNFDIALFGDSITRGSDFQLCFPDVRIINLGYSGDNILGMLKRIPMIQKSNAKKLFIMAGTNDLQHISLNEYRDRYERLIRNIQDSIPDIRIYVQSVIPTNSKLVGEPVRKVNYLQIPPIS